MTQSILFFVILSTLVAVNCAHKPQKFIGNAVNPAYPGQCYYKDEDVAIPIGSKYVLKKACEETECRSDFVLQFSTCPAYGNDRPECEKIHDKNALFPKCCVSFKCPK